MNPAIAIGCLLLIAGCTIEWPPENNWTDSTSTTLPTNISAMPISHDTQKTDTTKLQSSTTTTKASTLKKPTTTTAQTTTTITTTTTPLDENIDELFGEEGEINPPPIPG